MIDVVGVFFNDKGRIYYFSPAGYNLEEDTTVIVETERGLQFGKVVTTNTKVKKENLNLPLKRVIRVASKEDYNIHKNNLNDSDKALKECNRLIKKYNLNMKLIDASFTFDRKQLLFHFIADNRIDFRDLAKELASIYKTRIELRQIGVRDKAREVGGIGPCGRLLCCSRFLYSFDAVSINMAKNQNIALNPSKINGACGRLLCCLTYENEAYSEAKKNLPEVGNLVDTKYGHGEVIAVDVLNENYKVKLDNNDVITIEDDHNGSNS